MISNSISIGIAKKSQIFDSNMKLSVSVLQSLQYYNITADITSEYVAKDTILGKFFRNYYNISFQEKQKIDRYAKNFNVNNIYVVKRNELIGVNIRIKNKQFIYQDTYNIFDVLQYNLIFNNINREDPTADIDCNTLDAAINFNNEVFIEPDENVLLLAKDSNNNYVVYICYNGIIYNTSISPSIPATNVEYNVLMVFQLWDIDSMNNIKQVFPNMKDSPLSGSIRFNNLDNELIV